MKCLLNLSIDTYIDNTNIQLSVYGLCCHCSHLSSRGGWRGGTHGLYLQESPSQRLVRQGLSDAQVRWQATKEREEGSGEM